MGYLVYHDIGAVSKEYFCDDVEYKDTYVLLINVCGDAFVPRLALSPVNGDVRVMERPRLKAVA